MIQKVLNETPFQVLSDTFSISPSTTGYQLQVSANGKDYSTLFSVGAGVTRMCTGMANGSYYRLLGNEGEVAVNWRTSCKSGSGGGSGSGSTVVVNQILSAGTQIASIQVDNQTTMLYAPEGGQGAGDYQVVSELPASAEEGQMFYVLAHSGETATLSGWTFTDEGEETLGSIILRQEENDVFIAEIAANSNHNFSINNEWIGTDNTFKIITANGYDILAKCDGAGHCWAYLWQAGTEFEPEGADETFDYQAGTYEYSTSTDAATYRYLNGEFVLVPEGGLIHLETLSGVSGETGIMYECDGELYYWNENSGMIGKWNVLPATGTSMTNYRNWFTFKYTSVSAATQLISFQTHTGGNSPAYVLINPDRTLTGVNYAGQTKTIAVGETSNISYRTSEYYWTVVNNGNSISMAPIADNLTYQSKIVSIWDGNTNQPHWEMVNKTITPYVSGGTSTTTIGVPRVSSDGQILSYDQANKAGLKVNGTNKGSIYTTTQTQTLNWYIPTTSGISGQILQSNGDAAPTWVDMPGGGGPTQYVLNEMTQQERLALYNELLPYSGIGAGTIESAFTPSDYAFYLRGDTSSFDWGDQFRGIIPMTLAFYSPGDYGGAFFFTGVAGGRYGNGSILKVRYNIASDGSADYSYHWVNTPGISPFGFSYPDNGMLSYDLDNQKFIFTNWYDGTYMRDVDPTGSTPSIINNDWVDRFYNSGIFFANDRNAYATPCFGIRLVSRNIMDLYTFPKICVKGLSSPVTIDGRNYDKQYWFTYTKEDGSTFTISMLLNPNSYGAQMTYTAH